MMTEWLRQGLMAGVLGGAAALLAWGLCAALRRARAPGWLLSLIWLAVGLRFAVPGGVIPVTLPRPQDPALAQAAETVTQTVQTLNEASPAAEAPQLVLLAARAPDAPAFDWAAVAGLIWLGGAALLMARAVLAYAHLRYRVRLACKTPDGCYTCAAVDTPFTLGILRPRIYLPARLEGTARQAVRLHEQAHIRRGDTWVKPLYYAVVCLHWWNPLAWLAFRQLERAMEQACDEAAIRGCSEAQRARYCESLLQFAVGRAQPGALAFGQGSAKERILHALRYRAPGRLALGLCAATAVLAGFVLLAQPSLASGGAAAQQAVTPTAAPTPAPTAEPQTAAAAEADAPAADAGTPFDPAADFAVPVEYTYISRFYNAVYHMGDDLNAPKGTTVTAAAGGQVTVAEFHYSYGNYIVIDHGTDASGHRWESLYAHLDTIGVTVGQTVTQGEQIGTVGSTGVSTGNHLHLELHCDGELVPPQYCLPYSGTRLIQADTDGSLLALLRNPAMLDIAVQKAGAAQLSAPSAFEAPLDTYAISAAFGPGRNGLPDHTGTDLAAEAGSMVRAAAGGVVLAAGYDPARGYYVLLYHGTAADGTTYATLYSQLQTKSPLVPGTTVEAGTAVGVVGNSGDSTGPHLHLELWQNGQTVDPTGKIPL